MSEVEKTGEGIGTAEFSQFAAFVLYLRQLIDDRAIRLIQGALQRFVGR